MTRSIPAPSPSNSRCGALILLLLMCWAPLALAQPTGAGGTVPPEVKQQYNPATHKASLQQFIATQVEKLTSDDPVAQSQGRDALVREVETVGPIVPTPAYLDAYSQFLEGALAPAIAPDAPMRTRLNAAIVIERVTQRAPDTVRLLPAVLTILNDKSDPVVLWGVKAARWILPAVMKNQLLSKDQRLLTAIVPAAKGHAQGPLSGAIIREAYDAVSLGITDPVRGKRIDSNDLIARVIPEMHGLMALRVEQYRKSMPAEPSAEQLAALFLSSPRVWPLHKPDQQVRSVQLMNDLLWLAAQHVASGNPSPERDQLPQMIQRTGSALAVIPEISKDPAAAAALKPVTEVGPTMPGAQIKQRVEPVFNAIKAVAMFKGLTPPPVLGADAAAAPAPNTATAPVAPTTMPGAATAPAVVPPGKPAGPGAPPQPGAKPTAKPQPGAQPPPAQPPVTPPPAPAPVPPPAPAKPPPR